MLAYIILEHQEFFGLSKTLEGIYNADNLYCISVSNVHSGDALNELNWIRKLKNVYIISTPPTSWAAVAEALLCGIDFCLRISESWSSILVISGRDVPLLSQKDLERCMSGPYHDKIVMALSEMPVELDAPAGLLKRALADPFAAHPDTKSDNAAYNPFHRPLPVYQRDDVTLLVRPDAFFGGWTKTSHFFGYLVRHEPSPDRKQVYFENASQYLVRIIGSLFEDSLMGAAVMFMALPRDFCVYCANDVEALTFFSLLRNVNSFEEKYFAKVARSARFRDRVIHQHIMSVPNYWASLEPADVLKIESPPYLFARKAPGGPQAAPFFEEVYQKLGIEPSPDVLRARDENAGEAWPNLSAAFWRHVDITDHTFSFGVFQKIFCYAVRFGHDQELHYDAVTAGYEAEHIGTHWELRDDSLVMLREDTEFLKIEGMRVHKGQLLMFGVWNHHSTLLAFRAELEPLLRMGHDELVGRRNSLAEIALSRAAWSFWLSADEVHRVAFLADGRICEAQESGNLVGCWRADGDRLVAFGLGDSPIAIFDWSKAAGEMAIEIVGVSWGRSIVVEPCFLQSVPDATHTDRSL